jgi:H/ACA ribonucleoprotein complex subunit 3
MKMRKCIKCNQYTFKEICQKCNEKTISPLPPKFSPQDKFGVYRRKAIISLK